MDEVLVGLLSVWLDELRADLKVDRMDATKVLPMVVQMVYHVVGRTVEMMDTTMDEMMDEMWVVRMDDLLV